MQATTAQATSAQAQPYAPTAAPFVLGPVLFIAHRLGTCARLIIVALLLLLPGGVTLLA